MPAECQARGSGGSRAEQAPKEKREEGGTSPGENHAAGGRHSTLPAQEILEICTEYCSGNRSEGVTQAVVGDGGTREKLLDEFQRTRGQEKEGREERERLSPGRRKNIDEDRSAEWCGVHWDTNSSVLLEL